MVCGYLSLLYSTGEKPLEYWSKQQSKSGRIRKILDSDLLENVIELQDFEQPHGYGTSILCPSDSSKILNIELPILVVVIKNLNLQCRLQVQVVDTQNCLHHFQFSNSDVEKQNSKNVICRAKVKLETGWNKLELNFSHLTQSAFKQQYLAVQRLEICGNCRLRRIYFIDKQYDHNEICPKLYQQFLDSYMLKWGITAVEQSTQTNSTRKNKSKVRESNNARLNSKHLRIESLDGDHEGTTKDLSLQENHMKVPDAHFWRNLQMKVDMVINDFLDKQYTKFPYALDFKRQTKMKPYVLPGVSNEQKKLSSAISEDMIKKMDILRTFTESYVSTGPRLKSEIAGKSLQDDWRHRCFARHEQNVLNNIESVKRNTLFGLKKSTLQHKPKSLLLLTTETKSTGDKGIGSAKLFMDQLERKQLSTSGN